MYFTLDLPIDKLNKNDIAFLVSEACHILERNIIADIIGNRRKSYRYDIFLCLLKDQKEVTYNYFNNNNITEEHIELLSEFKNQYCRYPNKQYPSYSKDEWIQLLIKSLDDPTNENDIKMIHDIVNLMKKYNQIS